MKLDDNKKDDIIRKVSSGIEIIAKVLTKAIVGLVKAIIDAFR